MLRELQLTYKLMLAGDLVKCKWSKTMSYVDINGHFFTSDYVNMGEVFIFITKWGQNFAMYLRRDGQIRYAHSDVFEHL